MAKAPPKHQVPQAAKKPHADEQQRFISDRKYYGKNGKLYEPGEIIVLSVGDKPSKYMKPVDRSRGPAAADQAVTSEDPRNEAAGQQPGDLAEAKQSNPT
ncbi:MAG: hypothetical protein IPK23_15100 [Rhizobiales bacterium]|nr:hypothetical protein [Hyphomicrobiales bacterium]